MCYFSASSSFLAISTVFYLEYIETFVFRNTYEYCSFEMCSLVEITEIFKIKIKIKRVLINNQKI